MSGTTTNKICKVLEIRGIKTTITQSSTKTLIK